jgi:hypothetical protein
LEAEVRAATAARDVVRAFLVFFVGAFLVFVEGAVALNRCRFNGEGVIVPKALIKANSSCRSIAPSRSAPSSFFLALRHCRCTITSSPFSFVVTL